MTSVLFATHNPSKVQRFLQPLADKNFRLLTASDVSIVIDDPVENGDNEAQNAAIKAQAYFNALPDFTKIEAVLSLDTGVYFEGVEDEFQPKRNVQRIAGAGDASETDEERFAKMSQFYANLAKRFNSNLPGYFLDVFCLKTQKGEFFAEARRPFVLTSTIFHKDVHFPISSLYTVNGVPYHQLSQQQMQLFIQPSVDCLLELLLKID